MKVNRPITWAAGGLILTVTGDFLAGLEHMGHPGDLKVLHAVGIATAWVGIVLMVASLGWWLGIRSQRRAGHPPHG